MKWTRLALVAVLCFATIGCGEDTAENNANNANNNTNNRVPTGDVLYRFVCERTADRVLNGESPEYLFDVCDGQQPPAEAPSELVSLYEQKDTLIETAAQIVPQAVRPQAADTLELLAAEENAELFADMSAGLRLAAEQPGAAAAVTRLQFESKYRGFERQSLLVDFLEWEGSADVAQMGARTKIWETAEFESFLQVQAAEGANAARDAEAEAPTESFWLRPEFDSGEGRQVLVTDSRGLATWKPGDPFIDTDDDDLPDVDFAGRLVDADGNVIEDQYVFDNFQLLELSQTPLDRAVFAVANAMPEGRTQHLPNTFAALFGPAAARTADYGSGQLEFQSFDSSQSPLLDLYHALITIAAIPEIATFLQVAETHLLTSANGIFGTQKILDAVADDLAVRPMMTQEVDLDFNELGRQLGEAEFWENAAPLLDDEDSRAAVLAIAAMMTDARDVTFDPNDPNGPPVFGADKTVDWEAPAEAGNKSVFHRSLDLMAAMEGVEVCNPEGTVLQFSVQGTPIRYPLFGTASRCDIFRIENLGQAYRDAIAGNYEIPWGTAMLDVLVQQANALGIDIGTALEQAFGVPGIGQVPTPPDALTRFVFHSVSTGDGTATCNTLMPSTCGNPTAAQYMEIARDANGDALIDQHGAIAAAWDPAYGAFRPWMQLLRSTPVQAEVFTTLQAHWEPSEARQYERVFSTHAVEIVGSIAEDPSMDFAMFMLVIDTWFTGFAEPRDGQTIQLAGQSAPPTPANLMAYTHARRDQQWAEAGLETETEIFNEFMVNLADQFGTGSSENASNGLLGRLLVEQRLNVSSIDILGDRLDAIDAEVADLGAWIESPLVSTTMRLFAALYLRVETPTADLAMFLREHKEEISFEIANYLLNENTDLAVTKGKTWAPLFAPNAHGFVAGEGELPVESSAAVSAVRLWMTVAAEDATFTTAMSSLFGHPDDNQESSFEFLVRFAFAIAGDNGDEQDAVFVLNDLADFLAAGELGLADLLQRLIEDWRR